MSAVGENGTNCATTKVLRSFWFIGLLNNAPWVLMLACAPNISSGGVALVFLSNQIPGLIVKITVPYWFHKISYNARMFMASVSMDVACILVAFGGLLHDEFSGQASGADEVEHSSQFGMALELIGVSFISFQASLGEASSLALAGKFDSVILPKLNNSSLYYVLPQRSQSNNSDLNTVNGHETLFEEEMHQNNNNECTKQLNQCITAFSSGTGLAGIVGYAYKSLLSEVFGWGLSSVVFSVVLFAVAYYAIFYYGLYKEGQEREFIDQAQVNERGELLAQKVNPPVHMLESPPLTNNPIHHGADPDSKAVEMVDHSQNKTFQVTESTLIKPQPDELSSRDRFWLVLSLWPYTIPLFTVYAAEYMLQAGVWSTIGFPVTSAAARAQFYHYSNMSYQIGVFISRSSGNLFSVPLPILWLMPALQVVNLAFFWANSVHHFWYNYWLVLPCFYAGLLGGGVYVQGFSKINLDFPVELREFAIASAGVADSLGILVADIASLFIQSCIYDKNNIKGAVVGCPGK